MRNTNKNEFDAMSRDLTGMLDGMVTGLVRSKFGKIWLALMIVGLIFAAAIVGGVVALAIHFL